MQKILKKLTFILVFLFHFILICIVNYAMPSYKALYLIGAEVKRVDQNGLISKENIASKMTKDVYYIYAKSPIKDDKVMVFRNEDTRWGFPFYFKFNSADIQAKSAAFGEQKSLVEVKYYGWRIQVLNKFQNLISIKKIENQNALSLPIFSYIFYLIILASLVSCVIYTRKKFK